MQVVIGYAGRVQQQEVDLRGGPVYHNPAFSRMLGYDYDYRVGEDNRNRQTPEMAAVVFQAFNEVYRTYFKKELPARAFIGAGKLLALG